MKYRSIYTLSAALLLGVTMACNNKPKVIKQEPSVHNATPVSMPDDHVHTSSEGASSSQMHEVVVQEVLHADKYSYMHVAENGDAYWVAVPKQEIEQGATYYYQGGLRKVNFRSTEFDRVFDRIVLVSQLSRAPSGEGTSALDIAMAKVDAHQGAQDPQVSSSTEIVSLKTLYDNRQDYAGKVISVKGRCVKVNKNIMGRNWVHVRDGSDPSRELDLTVTTSHDVAVGSVVEMEGTIILNKDFGAGYKYEVIMEDAHVR